MQKKLSTTLSYLTLICLICGSTTTSQAACISMPSPIMAGIIRTAIRPVQVAVKSTATIVKKTVRVATAPVRVLAR